MILIAVLGVLMVSTIRYSEHEDRRHRAAEPLSRTRHSGDRNADVAIFNYMPADSSLVAYVSHGILMTSTPCFAREKQSSKPSRTAGLSSCPQPERGHYLPATPRSLRRQRVIIQNHNRTQMGSPPIYCQPALARQGALTLYCLRFSHSGSSISSSYERRLADIKAMSVRNKIEIAVVCRTKSKMLWTSIAKRPADRSRRRGGKRCRPLRPQGRA